MFVLIRFPGQAARPSVLRTMGSMACIGLRRICRRSCCIATNLRRQTSAHARRRKAPSRLAACGSLRWIPCIPASWPPCMPFSCLYGSPQGRPAGESGHCPHSSYRSPSNRAPQCMQNLLPGNILDVPQCEQSPQLHHASSKPVSRSLA